MKKLTISIVGLGFVGLTLAVVNASKGFSTIGIDIDRKKISNLQLGKTDFFEPGLDAKLKQVLKQDKIEFTSNFNEIINSDITFLTVGTPSKKDGTINLKFVNDAINQIIQVLKTKKTNHLIVIKSTVIPETTRKQIFPKIKNLKNINLVVNPEFLRESLAIHDLLNPHVIIIGEENKNSGNELVRYYKKFYKKVPEIIRTDFSTSEMIKYSNNSFLATKISFINNIGNLCQKIPNADVKTIAYAIGKDPRIGPLFLNVGPGFGGSCLPKDISAILNFSKKIGENGLLFKHVKKINDDQPEQVIKLLNKFQKSKRIKVISILGLAFKRNTDDIRESVSIKIVKKLLKKQIKIKTHDPMAIENFKKIFGTTIEYYQSIRECLRGSDCCIILTDWNEYKRLNEKIFEENMRNVRIIDSRRILNLNKFKKSEIISLGRG